MRELIIQKLKEIEQRENVRILYAVESGSRAWGFPSPGSDYDVRFLYVRPLEYYLKLEKTRDVIELPINEMLDINGWDLSKALQLLHGANPTLFEWLASPIVYRQTAFAEFFRSFAAQYFSPKKEIYHYISTAESTYRDFLMEDMVKLKKYFYALRPILACRWILETQTQPPMLFTQLVESQLPRELQGDRQPSSGSENEHTGSQADPEDPGAEPLSGRKPCGNQANRTTASSGKNPWMEPPGTAVL